MRYLSSRRNSTRFGYHNLLLLRLRRDDSNIVTIDSSSKRLTESALVCEEKTVRRTASGFARAPPKLFQLHPGVSLCAISMNDLQQPRAF